MSDTEILKKRLLWVLIALNFFFAAYSTLVFLVFLKVPAWLWVFLNICAPTQFITTVLLVLEIKDIPCPIFQATIVPFLCFFGTGGLFTFPWTGYMLMSQLSHITMTITWIFMMVNMISSETPKKWRKLGIGIGIGIIVVIIVNLIIFPVVFANPIAVQMLEEMGFQQ